MLNCVDLFSGAGGFSLSARLAGVQVRLAIEYDKHAVATYRHNLCLDLEGHPLVYPDDISTLSPGDVYKACFSENQQCDLLLGGPPCQGFSTHRIKGSGIDDVRNSLIHTYFEFVRTFRPTAFLMENVPGMLWPRHKDYIDKFYHQGAAAGYKLFDPVVLDSRDFGLPQRRKRVFILGVREPCDTSPFAWPPTPTHGSEIARRKSPELHPWVSCMSAFSPAPPNDPNDVHMKHSAELIDTFRRTPANGGSRKQSGRILPCHKDHDGHKDVYGRINPALPGPTMTTACINPSKGRFVHPIDHHGITVRQAARMQTFPDTFEFKGGLIAAGQQVGNAVPIQLGEFLINYLKPLLRAHEKKSESVPETEENEFA